MFWSIITTLNTQKITLLLHSFNNGFKTYERNTILKIILFINWDSTPDIRLYIRRSITK
jgi:hypothetical protein